MARSGLYPIAIARLLASIPRGLPLFRGDPGDDDSARIRTPPPIHAQPGSQNSLRADRQTGTQTFRLVFQSRARVVAGIERGANSGEKTTRIQLGSGRRWNQKPR